jgi:hypothetical protein
MASIWKTPLPGLTIGFTGNVGPITQVDTIGVWMQRPAGSPALEIRNVRLTMASEDSILGPTPLVDEFGQWIPASWPGKAGSVDDLRAAWEKEEGELETGKFNVSRYGGYLDKPAEATGFFRVEEIDGRWWFVDPDGYLFFSKGSCVMRPGGSFARVEAGSICLRHWFPMKLPFRTKEFPAMTFITGTFTGGMAATGTKNGWIKRPCAWMTGD